MSVQEHIMFPFYQTTELQNEVPNFQYTQAPELTIGQLVGI